MRQSHSVQNSVCASEDRDLMLFNAWLLACALFLEENSQPPRQPQAQIHIRKRRVCHVTVVPRTP